MIFRVLFAVIVPTLAGFLFVAYCLRSYRHRNVFENLIFGYGIGMSFVTFVMFLLGVLQIRFSLGAVLAMPVAAVLLLSYLIARSDTPFRDMLFPEQLTDKGVHDDKKWTKKQAVIVFFVVWIALKFYFVLRESSLMPVFTWDSFTNWSVGGKFFFYEKGLALNPLDEHFFGWGDRAMLSFPLHAFLLEVWFSLCMGSFHEVYVKFWNVFYFIGVVGLLFFALRRETSILIAVLAAFFLSSAPLLTFHALDAYADLAVGYYTLATAICFWRFIQADETDGSAKNSFLMLMGLFAALALWTKMEGLLFLLSFSAALICFFLVNKVPYKRLLPYLTPIAVVAVPWYSFLLVNHIPVLHHGRKSFEDGFHFDIFQVYFKQVVTYPNFNIIFPVFLMVCLYGWKHIFSSGVKYLLAVLCLVMSLFFYAYGATEEYVNLIQLTGVNRNTLTYLPLIYFIAAITIGKILQSLDAANGRPQEHNPSSPLAGPNSQSSVDQNAEGTLPV